MFTRSVLGLLYSYNRYDEMGLDAKGIFRRHGLSVDTIDEKASISRTKELEIARDLYRLKPEPILGLAMGVRMGLAGYGPYSMLLMTCENAYEACRMGIKYQSLTYLFGTLSIDLGPQNSALILEPSALPNEIAEFMLYRDIAGTIKFIRDIHQMNGVDVQIERVGFRTPAPESEAPFRASLDAPLLFGQTRNEILIPTQFLKAPYLQANQSAFNIYREQCDQLLSRFQTDPDALGQQLLHYLTMFVYHFPSVAETAATFGFSERSFRRSLAKEGTTYQRILDGVRFDKAKYWLVETALSMEQIATRLGYQEAAAFNHAFKRWANCTPSQYRRTIPSGSRPLA